MIISQDDIVRFKGKYLEMPNGCYEWQGHISSYGYGTFRIGDKQCRSHRVAYTIFKGDIPDGMCVCHACDNPKCVNPSHLWLGTHADNAQDRSKKNRSAIFRGEDSPVAKLTEDDVIKIKLRLKVGDKGTDIALDFDISKMQVSHIKTGKRWKHVSID